ncbi:SUMF1/EgtB/PvdO family nonheme iron enzyme [Parasphingorhabdus sp.]|uniref:SUMF1/EgtB/PvdO family nonheme iron enzyme n=1 Tax=Parasphingorhabdus sp. TaxID=2709688 RepID=UPI003593085E
MQRLYPKILLTLIGLICLIPSAFAQAGSVNPRLALVIANSDYIAFDRLSATISDGTKVATALSASGFSDASGEGAVRVRSNLGLAHMVAEIAAFKKALADAGPDAFGVLYYSGHGVALGTGGDVMMVPADTGIAQLPSATQLSRIQVTRDLMQSGAKTVLVVLDMCRNPINVTPPVLDVSLQDSLDGAPIAGSKGLKRIIRNPEGLIRPDQGYLVAYSTSNNQVAFDNGIFSKVLAEEISRPRQDIAEAMKRVSDRVALRSGDTFQKPTFDYGLQGQPPCFVSCSPEGGNRFYDCASCPWMIAISAGSTAFGSTMSETGRGKNEFVQRRETVEKGFALGVYEVTVAEWSACTNDKACPKITNWAKENPNPLIPASSISYEDANIFLKWLSEQSGRNYRMPSELEWEYASRASSQEAFPWGGEISPSEANYDQTATYRNSPKAPYRGYPEAVNAYPPNSFGLYQMQGNVWEWTSGCLDSGCSRRVVRGGSFQSVPAEIRSANRLAMHSSKRRVDVGLRVARDLELDEIGGGAAKLQQ